jgi:hypothetical protein
MKRIAILGVLGLLALVVAAPAAAKHSPTYSPTPPSESHKCVPHNVGYNAVGTLVDSALTAEENGRYSGTLEVKLTRANHHAPTGEQTFTLTGAKVKFHHGVDPTAPAAGSRVKLHGKITKLSKHCPTEGFTPTITVKKVDIRTAKH